MSTYYEAKGVTFQKVREDLQESKIPGVTLHADEDDDLTLYDGENYLHLVHPCVWKRAVGLKRWGRNDDTKIKLLLEEFYEIKFVHEEELGIMHIG
jgi:hypothetical protein